MKSSYPVWSSRSSPLKWTLLAAGVVALSGTGVGRLLAASNTVLWDTFAPIADGPELTVDSNWKRVPSDLLTLEADPPKASSDPGYYGREYSFRGDAVVEARGLCAAFLSEEGRVVFYSNASVASTSGSAPGNSSPAKKMFEFIPFGSTPGASKPSRCDVVRNAGDEVALKVEFGSAGSGGATAMFVFDKSGVVEIKAVSNLKNFRLLASMEYAVVPDFIGDDLIFGAGDFESAESISIPAENLLLGLMEGERNELIMTWPQGQQKLSLQLGAGDNGKRLIRSIDFDNDGRSVYLAALSAPGIWHRETLRPAYLEKDVTIDWKRPFPAKWKTQLYEEGVKTTFAFRGVEGQIWRGVPGSYSYPVWFNGDGAVYHLGKKVPPKGESLIYFVEGRDTPVSISTPVDVLKSTLGRQASESILDVTGRKLRTHHRRGGDGVRRACTCGCTETIQAIFESGKEVQCRDDIAAALGDMNYFVERHVARISEYREFADKMIKFLQAAGASSPALKGYVEDLEQIVRQIPEEFSVQKENMGSSEHATTLTKQTLALADRQDSGNVKAYMELLKAWRAMGGAQDYVVARCHMITRRLSQEAGYGCAAQPNALALAAEVRGRCREILRNPDGYEIWADY